MTPVSRGSTVCPNKVPQSADPGGVPPARLSLTCLDVLKRFRGATRNPLTEGRRQAAASAGIACMVSDQNDAVEFDS